MAARTEGHVGVGIHSSAIIPAKSSAGRAALVYFQPFSLAAPEAPSYRLVRLRVGHSSRQAEP